MGDMLAAACDCGYEAGDLFVGCGFAGPKSCTDLASCAHCRKLVTVGSAASRQRCPTCRRKVQKVKLPKMEPSIFDDLPFTPVEPILQCPRCGNQTLKVWSHGMWD